MVNDLLGYSGNLKPLSITQDATVRAPKQRDTKVATAIQDNSGVRKWQSVSKAISNTARLISTVGNIQTKEKEETRRENEKKQRVLLEQYKTEFSKANLGFNAQLTTTEAADVAGGKRTDYGRYLIDFKDKVLSPYGVTVDNNGNYSIGDSEFFNGMDEETKQKAIAYSMSTGFTTFDGLNKKLTHSLIANKKEVLDASVTPVVMDTVRSGVNVATIINDFKKISTEKGLQALQMSEFDVRNFYYTKALKDVEAIKSNKVLLKKFLDANTTTDEDILNTPSYQLMMVKAQTYYSSKTSGNTKAFKGQIKAAVLSGSFTPLVPLIQGIKIQNFPDGSVDVDTSSPNYKKIKPYLELEAEANGFDLNTPMGRRATLMQLHKDSLKSSSYQKASLVNQHLDAGGILNKADYDVLPDDVKQEVKPKIKAQVVKALDILSSGDESQVDTALEILNTYKSYGGTKDTVSSYINQQRDVIINEPVDTKDGKIPAIEADARGVAIRLADKWSKYPRELKAYISAKDKEIYELSTFVSENPSFAEAYREIMLNPDSVQEVEKTIAGNQEYAKAKAKFNLSAGGYGKEAEDYLRKAYVLTRDVKKAEQLTEKIYGLQDVGGDVKLSPKLLDLITVEGDVTDEVEVALHKQLHLLTNNAYADSPVEIIDIPGNKTKIVYHKKNGAQIPVITTDDKIAAFFKQTVASAYKPKSVDAQLTNSKYTAGVPNWLLH